MRRPLAALADGELTLGRRSGRVYAVLLLSTRDDPQRVVGKRSL